MRSALSSVSCSTPRPYPYPPCIPLHHAVLCTPYSVSTLGTQHTDPIPQRQLTRQPAFIQQQDLDLAAYLLTKHVISPRSAMLEMCPAQPDRLCMAWHDMAWHAVTPMHFSVSYVRAEPPVSHVVDLVLVVLAPQTRTCPSCQYWSALTARLHIRDDHTPTGQPKQGSACQPATLYYSQRTHPVHRPVCQV